MSSSMNDQLDAIFGIPKDGSNIKQDLEDGQEDSYAEVIVSDDGISFDQKAKLLNDQLSKDAPSVNVTYVSKMEENKNVQPKPAEQSKSSGPVKDKFEEILSQALQSKQSNSKEVLPVVQEQTNDHKEIEAQDEPKSSNEVSVVNSSNPLYEQKFDDDGWYLSPPSPMFNHFYVEKASLINHIIKNGKPIDFDKFTLELKNSSVSTNIEITDMKGMSDRLTKIQDLLDRVVQIKIQATSQCVAFKRGVELLRGVLAKVTYEKPAARQDGVIYDHMRDIEMYASKLESLEQNAKDVYHNLLEAKEILSRKISISLELLKEQSRTEGLERNFNSLPDNVKKVVNQQKSSTDLADEGFDKLEVQEAIVKSQNSSQEKTIKKTGTVPWL